jgi:two-component system chemotaxis sensor kinase CheA
VKPLSRQLKGLGEYAGTTIMGDGTVALILDVLGLAVASGLSSEVREASHAKANKEDTQNREQTQSLLVVDLGDSRRFALPTSMVARLEKVPASAIEDANGRQVIQYRGAILPLVRLSRVFGSAEVDETREQDLQIIVYSEDNLNCGFVVNRIVDIVETELRLQTKNGADDNLLGTTVIQQRVTDVLNLRNLARHEARSDAGNLLAAYGEK